VLPTGVGSEVGEEPTAAADAGAAMAVGVGRWSRGGTPFGTLREHFRTKLAQPFSSWFLCERRLHRLR
jgi:hypothetical protein